MPHAKITGAQDCGVRLPKYQWTRSLLLFYMGSALLGLKPVLADFRPEAPTEKELWQ